MNEERNVNDTVEIGEDVIAVIAGIAAGEVAGISARASHANTLGELLGKKGMPKGVKVSYDEQEALVIDLSVIADYGVKIPEAALTIQEKVKEAVQTMTGREVTKVNIKVEGLRMPEQA